MNKNINRGLKILIISWIIALYCNYYYNLIKGEYFIKGFNQLMGIFK